MGSKAAAFRALTGNRALLRVVAAYALFTLTEYAVWIAMLVYAYARGGAAVAGLVALAQLVPAALLAPLLPALAARRPPAALLAGGYLAQAAGMGATAAGVALGVPAAAYAAAVVASTAVTATRPAQATLVPALAATPDQLTAANVAVGWVEAAGITAAGALTGLLISLSGPGGVFAACAVAGLGAALLVAGLRAPALAGPRAGDPLPGDTVPGDTVPGGDTALADTGAGGLRASVRLAARQPRLRLLLALLTAQAVVVGALDLLFVILAVSVLGRSQAWAGYLNAADGAGAMLAAAAGVLLVGRRLSAPILGAALLLSGAIAATAAGAGLGGTLALLAVAGASRGLLDLASRTLLQRSVPAQSLGAVFGLLEGLTMAGLALGALLVPALAHFGGSRPALLGVAALLPLAVLAGGRALLVLDTEAPVPVVQIALLRAIPLFAEMPAPALAGVAAALTPVRAPAGTTLIRQGDPGDCYYAVAAGEFDVIQDRRVLRRVGRGAGIGELALLRDIPRTATVTAVTDALAYRLGREPFLTAVLGHAATRTQADGIARRHLAADAARGRPDPAAQAGPGH